MKFLYLQYPYVCTFEYCCLLVICSNWWCNHFITRTIIIWSTICWSNLPAITILGISCFSIFYLFYFLLVLCFIYDFVVLVFASYLDILNRWLPPTRKLFTQELRKLYLDGNVFFIMCLLINAQCLPHRWLGMLMHTIYLF